MRRHVESGERFLSGLQTVPYEQSGPTRDCGIRDVEGWPMISGRMKVEKINDGSEREAVNYVSERTA